MEYVLKETETPHRWQVVLRGHVDDLEGAREALYENLEGVWEKFIQESDDDEGDEATLTITLNWIDQGMIQMARSIVEEKYNYVRIIYNGGVNNRGDRIRI
jgi:hypothetical protein